MQKRRYRPMILVLNPPEKRAERYIKTIVRNYLRASQVICQRVRVRFMYDVASKKPYLLLAISSLDNYWQNALTYHVVYFPKARDR